MFERFTERARQVVVLAQDEARLFNHDYIGTEHLLLGILREKEGVAARVLDAGGLTAEDVRNAVHTIVGIGDAPHNGQIPFTPRAKKVLELALREALSLNHNYIGTEHILLGLIREGEGVAMRIIEDHHLTENDLRHDVIEMLQKPKTVETPYSHPHREEKETAVFSPKTPSLEGQRAYLLSLLMKTLDDPSWQLSGQTNRKSALDHALANWQGSVEDRAHMALVLANIDSALAKQWMQQA